MVKSETFFCRLIGIDTLFSFDGIIPSAADFQLKLTSLIEQLNKALLAENQLQTESEALCQALCGYFDKRLTNDPQNNSLSWQRYSLMHYFYGYNESKEALSLPAQLEVLLKTDSDVMFRYAWKLLTLLIQVEGQTETLVSLRSASRARYFSRVRPSFAPPESETTLWGTPSDTLPASPRLMVCVIGPFAGKWFSQSDLSTSNDSGIVWVVAEHATSLVKRLEHLKESHSSMATLAFFPLLADGFQNNGIMIEQITAWQYAFASTRLPEHLPCMLGLYTRLSQQRYPHDPDGAIWTGGLAAPPYGDLKLEPRLVGLIDELDAGDDGNDIYAIQRHALGSTFVAWLAESRIMNVLQTMFDSTQLDLAGVTLADHGQGFIRHGAWSLWLAEKYSILPGLSASIALPPLPVIPLPPIVETPPPPPPGAVPTIIALKPSRRRWPKITALLVLFACLAGGLIYYNGPHWGGIRDQLTQLNPFRTRFKEPTPASDVTQYTLSGSAPLFENGSSNLMPDSEKILAEIVPKMVRAPEQMFLIIGHSDNTGSAAVNLALSTERARVIRDWLVEHGNLSASQFIVEGAGNSRPVASNDTQKGRAQNRRVEIIPLSTQPYKD
ncbi:MULTISPECIES: OmpA family protein [unclassified Serratia (in: enterobacteria)]|uniref:OmpA family protein n=1 Tax=unclassified Serratia (in: enterobacteria) TaxID=2647522 RepID=UPI002ED5FD7B|nr:OmpA family protein [Serratia sp. C2(2)]MEE4448037.1 OmpA family protein [Serratia sp. C2(1)]